MKKKFNKKTIEWIESFIKEEVKAGLSRKEARKQAEEVIHNLKVISLAKK